LSKRILLSGAFLSCLPAHVFWPCMVLHKTTQHRSTCSFNNSKRTLLTPFLAFQFCMN
jgi:hypothetical protein